MESQFCRNVQTGGIFRDGEKVISFVAQSYQEKPMRVCRKEILLFDKVYLSLKFENGTSAFPG